MSDPFAAPFDQPDPDAVARSERFIDALAKREPVDFVDVGDTGDNGDRALAGLLEDWRDELRVQDPSGVCPEQNAVAVLNRGLAARRRARRRMALVSALAAAVLGVAGFGMLFGEPASVHDDQIAVSAETDLDQVQQMIALGQWDQAQDKLAAVGAHVQTVKDNGRKQGLIDKVNLLNAKVATRDRNATVPPNVLPGTAPAVSATATVSVIPSGDPVITIAPNPFGG
jgi:Anti-sigma-D factor RsdA to sigma factor binding region